MKLDKTWKKSDQKEVLDQILTFIYTFTNQNCASLACPEDILGVTWIENQFWKPCLTVQWLSGG